MAGLREGLGPFAWRNRDGKSLADYSTSLIIQVLTPIYNFQDFVNKE